LEPAHRESYREPKQCERISYSPQHRILIKAIAETWSSFSMPALGDAQARELLDDPPADSLKGVRDRAILAALVVQATRVHACGPIAE
jgi:hypothetical protein